MVYFQQYELINSQSFFSFSNGFSNNINYEVRLEETLLSTIFPRSGSNFSLSLKLTLHTQCLKRKTTTVLEIKKNLNGLNIINGTLNLHGIHHSPNKLVLNTKLEMGLLGAYNNQLGIAPFERFMLEETD